MNLGVANELQSTSLGHPPGSIIAKPNLVPRGVAVTWYFIEEWTLDWAKSGRRPIINNLTSDGPVRIGGHGSVLLALDSWLVVGALPSIKLTPFGMGPFSPTVGISHGARTAL